MQKLPQLITFGKQSHSITIMIFFVFGATNRPYYVKLFWQLNLVIKLDNNCKI